MGIYSIKPAFRKRLFGLRDRLIQRGVSADALTATAFFVSVLGFLAFSRSQDFPILLFLIPILALARITLNALDGMVATATGTARPMGEVFNEVSDRLSDVAWLVGLIYIIDARIALGALAAALLASFVGVVVKAAGGPRIYAGIVGKADRMLILAVASPVAFFAGPIALAIAAWIIAAGSAITVLQRIAYARQHLPNGDGGPTRQ